MKQERMAVQILIVHFISFIKMEEEKKDPIMEFNPVKDYLEHGLEDKEVFLWDEEIEKVIRLARRIDQYRNNVGIRVQRIEHNNRERAFHDQWLKENIPCPGLNHGNGILQDLFIESKLNTGLTSPVTTEKITNRDRMIVATVIQWLGSNVGMAFLQDSLKRFDARIMYKTDKGEEREY